MTFSAILRDLLISVIAGIIANYLFTVLVK